jgi:bifunctional DNA-binding transcriptional regulator/antitoxin component of YhaV-PrlF toxin-antitoxin module
MVSGPEIVLGTSKIDPRYRVTLIQPLPDLLDVKVGDLIIFVKDKEGNIVIKASRITKLKKK